MSGSNGMGIDGLGATIGAKIATHVTNALLQARVRMGPHQASIAQHILTDFTNHVSDEIRGVMSPLWSRIAESPDAQGWVRDLAHRLANERGQAWAWIAGNATSAALGSGVLALLTNELQPVIGANMKANPHMPLAPADAAAAVARGLWTSGEGWGDAGQYGIDRTRFDRLVKLNQRTLSATETLELYARGSIDETAAIRDLERDGWEVRSAGRLLALARRHISIQDGASMWNRSIVTDRELRELARLNGYDPDDASRYAELSGEPLPIQDALTALRRGIIDEAKARRAWVQGPVRNEWFDTALALQYAPMSTVDAADAVNQGHLSLAEGRKVAEWNGLMSEHFDTLIQNAGLPPGVELASEALNRGLVTEDEFRTIFLESRLKNRYIDLYTRLRYRVMPQETVRRLYRENALTYEQAVQRLGWAGFSPEDAVALLSIEDSNETSAERELTKTEILSLYTDRVIDEATARDMLAGVGYSGFAVDWQISMADHRRARRYADAVTARVRAGYVAGRFTYDDAATLLDTLRVPASQREELISLWDLERLATTKGLTVAQIQGAVRRGLISPADGQAEFVAQGYSDHHASILLALGQPAPR